MTKPRSYFTASKKSKIAIATVERKLTQTQIRSEYGVHTTQIKARHSKSLSILRGKSLQKMNDFSMAPYQRFDEVEVKKAQLQEKNLKYFFKSGRYWEYLT